MLCVNVRKRKKKALEGLLKSLKKSCLVCASVILKVAAKCRLVERRSPLKALGGDMKSVKFDQKFFQLSIYLLLGL